MPPKRASQPKGLAEAPPHYHGHRDRLRARFMEAGSDALADYEMLELVLFRAIPMRDVKPLDKRNQLIADEVQQEGTVDHTPVYPREVVKRALELSATAVILVHNHPSGDPTPSHADIEMTRQVANVAKPLGVTLFDHIIVGK